MGITNNALLEEGKLKMFSLPNFIDSDYSTNQNQYVAHLIVRSGKDGRSIVHFQQRVRIDSGNCKYGGTEYSAGAIIPNGQYNCGTKEKPGKMCEHTLTCSGGQWISGDRELKEIPPNAPQRWVGGYVPGDTLLQELR